MSNQWDDAPGVTDGWGGNDDAGFGGAIVVADENGGFDASSMTCHNCNGTGHMARECPEPKKMVGECFNCGQVGHNKADCTNPKVDRPFTGTCRICEKEGHPAAECPDKPAMLCRICNHEGHRAMECTSARMDVFPSTLEKLTADQAWIEMADADKEGDVTDFKHAFLAYAKALIGMGTPVELADVEKGFRSEGRKIFLIAKEREHIPANMTIVNLAGKIDQKYVLAITLSDKPKREKFAVGWPESAEENLERLTSCGFVMDRLVPMCDNCGELGHIRKHCKEERVEPSEPRVEVTCVICKEAGHRARDCTSERVDPFACRNCKQSGHTSAECTEPRSAEGVECKRCNEMGHFAKDCPTGGGPRTCRNCGSEDHIAKECTEPRNPATMTCRNCDEVGHMARDCPKPRDYSKMQCRNCGEMGHGITRCKAPKAEENGGGFGGAATGNGGFGAANDGFATADTGGDAWPASGSGGGW